MRSDGAHMTCAPSVLIGFIIKKEIMWLILGDPHPLVGEITSRR